MGLHLLQGGWVHMPIRHSQLPTHCRQLPNWRLPSGTCTPCWSWPSGLETGWRRAASHRARANCELTSLWWSSFRVCMQPAWHDAACQLQVEVGSYGQCPCAIPVQRLCDMQGCLRMRARPPGNGGCAPTIQLAAEPNRAHAQRDTKCNGSNTRAGRQFRSSSRVHACCNESHAWCCIKQQHAHCPVLGNANRCPPLQGRPIWACSATMAYGRVLCCGIRELLSCIPDKASLASCRCRLIGWWRLWCCFPELCHSLLQICNSPLQLRAVVLCLQAGCPHI